MRPRYGDWVQTLTGHRFYVLDPEPEDIDILDVAGALSKICRFNGHPKAHYPVGQHCVLGSYVVEEQTHDLMLALAFLLHDSGEAYLGDMTRPLKNMPELEAYRLAEKKLNRTIERRFFLPAGILEEKIIKEVDTRMLFTEKRDLLVFVQWGHSAQPYDFKIKPWSWRKAERRYLERYHELCLRLDGYSRIVIRTLQITRLLSLVGGTLSTREQ